MDESFKKLNGPTADSIQSDYIAKEQRAAEELLNLQSGNAKKLANLRSKLLKKLNDEALEEGKAVEEYLADYGLQKRLDALNTEVKATRSAHLGHLAEVEAIQTATNSRLAEAEAKQAKRRTQQLASEAASKKAALAAQHKAELSAIREAEKLRAKLQQTATTGGEIIPDISLPTEQTITIDAQATDVEVTPKLVDTLKLAGQDLEVTPRLVQDLTIDPTTIAVTPELTGGVELAEQTLAVVPQLQSEVDIAPAEVTVSPKLTGEVEVPPADIALVPHLSSVLDIPDATVEVAPKLTNDINLVDQEVAVTPVVTETPSFDSTTIDVTPEVSTVDLPGATLEVTPVIPDVELSTTTIGVQPLVDPVVIPEPKVTVNPVLSGLLEIPDTQVQVTPQLTEDESLAAEVDVALPEGLTTKVTATLDIPPVDPLSGRLDLTPEVGLIEGLSSELTLTPAPVTLPELATTVKAIPEMEALGELTTTAQVTPELETTGLEAEVTLHPVLKPSLEELTTGLETDLILKPQVGEISEQFSTLHLTAATPEIEPFTTTAKVTPEVEGLEPLELTAKVTPTLDPTTLTVNVIPEVAPIEVEPQTAALKLAAVLDTPIEEQAAPLKLTPEVETLPELESTLKLKLEIPTIPDIELGAKIIPDTSGITTLASEPIQITAEAKTTGFVTESEVTRLSQLRTDGIDEARILEEILLDARKRGETELFETRLSGIAAIDHRVRNLMAASSEPSRVETRSEGVIEAVRSEGASGGGDSGSPPASPPGPDGIDRSEDAVTNSIAIKLKNAKKALNDEATIKSEFLTAEEKRQTDSINRIVAQRKKAIALGAINEETLKNRHLLATEKSEADSLARIAEKRAELAFQSLALKDEKALQESQRRATVEAELAAAIEITQQQQEIKKLGYITDAQLEKQHRLEFRKADIANQKAILEQKQALKKVGMTTDAQREHQFRQEQEKASLTAQMVQAQAEESLKKRKLTSTADLERQHTQEQQLAQTKAEEALVAKRHDLHKLLLTSTADLEKQHTQEMQDLYLNSLLERQKKSLEIRKQMMVSDEEYDQQYEESKATKALDAQARLAQKRKELAMVTRASTDKDAAAESARAAVEEENLNKQINLAKLEAEALERKAKTQLKYENEILAVKRQGIFESPDEAAKLTKPGGFANEIQSMLSADAAATAELDASRLSIDAKVDTDVANEVAAQKAAQMAAGVSEAEVIIDEETIRAQIEAKYQLERDEQAALIAERYATEGTALDELLAKRELYRKAEEEARETAAKKAEKEEQKLHKKKLGWKTELAEYGLAGQFLDSYKQAFDLKSMKEKFDNADDKEAANAEIQANFDAAMKQMGNWVNSLASTGKASAAKQAGIDTRLQGASGKDLAGGSGEVKKRAGSYWKSISADITKGISVSPLFKAETVEASFEKIVNQGIAFNVKERAFLDTLKDKIATTFEVADGTLLKLVRIQQADTTAARLGMESALTEFLNSMYATTEYMQQAADTVRQSLYEATALMDAKSATEFEFSVQKWLGSLYSVGFSATDKIADTLGKITAGDISGITEGGLGNLLVMAANEASLPIATILEKGLDASQSNKLMSAMVQYLEKIYTETKGSKVLAQQFAGVYGLTASDLVAAHNLSKSVAQVEKTGETYDTMLRQVYDMAGTMYQRTSVGEMFENLKGNFEHSMAATLANNPVLSALNMTANMLNDLVGGIDIPFVNVMGFGFDLNASVADLMNVAALSGAVLGGVGKLVAGLGNAFSTDSMLRTFGVDKGKLDVQSRGASPGLATVAGGSSTSESGYVGNENGEDIKEKTVSDASAEPNKTIAEAKEDEEDKEEARAQALAGHIVDIYELLQEVVSGTKKFHVKLDVGNTPTAWSAGTWQ